LRSSRRGRTISLRSADVNDPNMTGFVRAPPATRSAPPPVAAVPEKRSFILDFLVN